MLLVVIVLLFREVIVSYGFVGGGARSEGGRALTFGDGEEEAAF